MGQSASQNYVWHLPRDVIVYIALQSRDVVKVRSFWYSCKWMYNHPLLYAKGMKARKSTVLKKLEEIFEHR